MMTLDVNGLVREEILLESLREARRQMLRVLAAKTVP
jgi:hypothetical protein